MAHCEACNHEVEPGYTFCQSCGAPIGPTNNEDPSTSTTSLADLVDGALEIKERIQQTASNSIPDLDRWLGSPVSIARQILYALASGFAITCWLPLWGGWSAWPNAWLFVSFLLYWPVRHWTTGIVPLSRTVTVLIGDELSLRRRLILALGLTLPVWMVWRVVLSLRTAVLELEGSDGDPLALLLFLVGTYLVSFYLMGFVSSWRAVSPSGFWVTQENLAGRARDLTDQIMEAVRAQDIAGVLSTRIRLEKLQGSTWIPSSTLGEQLSLTCGKARVVIFIQQFGTGLFLRTKSFYDASGRRLWLLIGLFVSFLEGLFRHWLGTSYLMTSQQVSEILSPASKQQVVLRGAWDNLIIRALRLVEGVSEYSWNEIHALEGAIRESVITTLETAVGSHEAAERIRSQIENQVNEERQFASGGRGSRA